MAIYSKYDKQFIIFLFSLHKRPGCFIGSPSIEKLANFMVGYEVAVHELTGYQIVVEREFRRFLCKKHYKEEWECSLIQLIRQGKTDEKGFDSFFEELSLFCEHEHINLETNGNTEDGSLR